MSKLIIYFIEGLSGIVLFWVLVGILVWLGDKWLRDKEEE
jgi:hypothetical protein